jgi:hypothetical protein
MTATTSDGVGDSSDCPYCGGPLAGGLVCASCGTICARCGTPSRDGVCPECSYSSSPIAASTPWSQPESPYGEVAPDALEKIVRHGPGPQYLSRTERNLLRGTFVDPQAKLVHDRAAAACEKLPLPPQTRASLTERIEREAGRPSLRSGMTTDESVAFLVLSEMRRLGFPLSTVQASLARAGFRMKLDSVSFRIAVPGGARPQLRVNGNPRTFRLSPCVDPRPANVLRALDLEDHSPMTLRVQLYLIDALDAADELATPPRPTARLDLSDALFLGRDGALAPTATVPLGNSRCFTLFKTHKHAAVDAGRSSTPLNPDAFIRPLLPSNVLPVSAEIMREAGALRQVEARAVADFRQVMSAASGRTPRRLALESLYRADRTVFARSSEEAKSRARLRRSELHLRDRRDLSYTGVVGFLLPSEVARVFGAGIGLGGYPA